MREMPISSGIARHGTPIRQRAKTRTAKNAVEATTCPDGNAWYFELKRGPFQTSSVLTEGRARPVEILTTRAANPASASAININKKMRVHFLFPRGLLSNPKNRSWVAAGANEGGRMGLRMRVHDKEPIGQALRRFKKLIERSGMQKELRAHQYYEKPCEQRRRAQGRHATTHGSSS